ncbi:MAG: BatA domain-containing protein, partial [Planctomycetia bacterium]
MPVFDFPLLAWWGLPIVAVPVIIHLITLLRHRKVRWAAMDFLLASQKKYRTRVLLKQLLLLLLRMAAVAGIVLALAQPRWTSALGRMLGGGRTVHVVLLDDSYSMGDVSHEGRVGET